MHASNELRDLLRKILNTDHNCRLSTSQINQHKWVKKYRKKYGLVAQNDRINEA